MTGRRFRSDLIADFAIALLGVVCLWEGVLKAYMHYNSIWANSEPLDYLIAGLSIAVGSSILISLKGVGRRPSYSFPLVGMIFGAFKIYTDIRDPGDILVSTVLISGCLILLSNALRLERKWILTAIAECWLTILSWSVAMLSPTLFLWDYSLLFSWVILFVGLLLWITHKGSPRLALEEPFDLVKSSAQASQGGLVIAAQLAPRSQSKKNNNMNRDEG